MNSKESIIAHIKKGKAIMEKEKMSWGPDLGPMNRSYVNTNVIRSTFAAGFSHIPHKRAEKDNSKLHKQYAMTR